jgi:hypothetical protein
MLRTPTFPNFQVKPSHFCVGLNMSHYSTQAMIRSSASLLHPQAVPHSQLLAAAVLLAL